MVSSDGVAGGGHRRWVTGLGWFSLGLGAVEILAPRMLSWAIGAPKRTGLLRWLGLREVVNGLGILFGRSRRPWVAARVGGDMMDAALLGSAFGSSEASRPRLVAATLAVAGVTALDVLTTKRIPRSGARTGEIHFKRSVAIDRSPEELYRFWHDFENLPRFMNHLTSVRSIGSRRTHWAAKGPAHTTVEWDAVVTEDEPGKLISWRTVERSTVDHMGSVRFEPGPTDRATTVHVEMWYRAPGGSAGALIAKVFGENPEKQVRVDLRRFKQLMETGEIATTEGQPAGRTKSTSRKYDDFVRA